MNLFSKGSHIDGGACRFGAMPPLFPSLLNPLECDQFEIEIEMIE